MGRTPIEIKLWVTSSDDDRFAKRRIFYSIPKAVAATGLNERGVKAAYHSKETSMKKKSGEVYNFKWEEPFTPINPKICHFCSKTLSFMDKSASFSMSRDNFNTHKLEFESISEASRRTGISINAQKCL